MPHSAVVFSVFIASPSDVTKERELIRQVLATWNAINSKIHSIVLQPVGWEVDSYPSLGSGPQAEINKQLLKDADLLIGVFWTRIGTPTPDHESGSVEEIKRHHEAGKPVMLYFSTQPVAPDSVDPTQYVKLKDFKTWCQERGLVESFESSREFVEKLQRQISIRINTDPYFRVHGKDADASTSMDGAAYPNGEPQLSEDAKLILGEAAMDSSGTIMRVHMLNGLVVQTNGKGLGTEGRNPRVEAELEAAISLLEQEGLIEAGNYKREIFRVTARGYEVADRLKNA